MRAAYRRSGPCHKRQRQLLREFESISAEDSARHHPRSRQLVANYRQRRIELAERVGHANLQRAFDLLRVFVMRRVALGHMPARLDPLAAIWTACCPCIAIARDKSRMPNRFIDEV